MRNLALMTISYKPLTLYELFISFQYGTKVLQHTHTYIYILLTSERDDRATFLPLTINYME
jgi:hypothetical protein